MGQFNSSVTRVWPVFDALLARDPTGRSWLPRLLELAPHRLPQPAEPTDLLPCLTRCERAIPAAVAQSIGPEATARIGPVRHVFEVDLPPSAAFLRWLIENPNALSWPAELGGSARTRQKRSLLRSGDLATRQEALGELATLGVEKSARRWWAFEGFTSVDCLLETETLVLLIEGKRCEGVSLATRWYPKRNQLVRNVEAARARAAGRKQFAVLQCAQRETPISDSDWSTSLPHLPGEVHMLKAHYLGCVLWPEIVDALCPGLALPRTVDDAVQLLSSPQIPRSR
jgi:hypothetical protein